MSAAGAWSEIRLGDAITLQRGFDLPSRERQSGNFPIVSSSGKSGTHNEGPVKGPGVVTGRYGTIGQVFYIDEDFWPLNTTLFVKDFKGNDPRLVYYLLQTVDFLAHSDKTSVPGVNRNHLHLAPILLPPLSDQRVIAYILGTLDDKIELNRRMNEALEEMARALFKSWFVDFDPMRAKAQGRQPAGVDAATAALFPDSFEESGLGPIPAGWQGGKVGEHFKVAMGQSPPGSTYNEEGDGLPFYQGNADFGFRFPRARVYCTAPTRLAEAGDTLVSVRAPVGAMNMAIEKCCIGRGVAAVRHNSGSSTFTYHAMRGLSAAFDVFEGEGTVFGSVSKTDFHNLSFVAPSAKIVTAFDCLAAPLDRQIETNETENETLSRTRDVLLPKLLSGEIRVKEAQRLVEAAI